MESKLEKRPWGWEYVSKSGLEYAIGEVTVEFNVVVDLFGDIDSAKRFCEKNKEIFNSR